MFNNELGIDDDIYSCLKYVEECKIIPKEKYFQKNAEKILEALKNEKCKLIFPNAYNLLINSCKPVKNLNFNEKLEEFLLLTEENCKFPDTTKARFSDMSLVGNFLSANIVKIYSLTSAGWYNEKYPLATEKIEEYYNKSIIKKKFRDVTEEDLMKAFLAVISSEKRIPKSNSKLTFLDDRNVYNFWLTNKDNLYSIVITGKYDELYPLGTQLVKDEYNKYLMRRERFDNGRKIKNKFFQFVEENLKIPTMEDEVYCYEGFSMYEYWLQEKSGIALSASTNEYKSRYPSACKLIAVEYYKIIKDIKILEEYFSIIEKEQQLPGYLDNRTLSNGVIIGPYWYNNQKMLYDMANTHEYNKKYPKACQFLIDSYIQHEFLIMNKESFRKKVEEILSIVEKDKEIPNAHYCDKKFSDGTNVSSFMERYIYITVLYKMIQTGEYDEKYPVAVTIFKEKFEEKNNKNFRKK